MNQKLTSKQLAQKISELIKLISDNTGCCGNNLLFYNDVSKHLLKMDIYNIEKLENIIKTTVVLGGRF